jgi:outer membrane protein
MCKKYLFLMLFLGLSKVNFVKAETLLLGQAIILAQQNSQNIKAAEKANVAAEASAEMHQSLNYPKLSLDANYRQQSVVPEMRIGQSTQKLGDDHSYSVGPTLNWMLWDSGLRKNNIVAAEFLAKSKKHQLHWNSMQVRLSAQLAYVQVVLAQETLQNSKQAAQLTRQQNKDIQNRYRSGSVSKLDALGSDTEVANYQLKVEQAMGESDASEVDFSYLIGQSERKATDLQNLDQIIEQFEKHERSAVGVHPMLASQKYFTQSRWATVQAQRSSYWPSLNLQLRTSIDYPNGPNFAEVQQNLLTLNLTWSIYDFGFNKNQIAAKVAEAEGAASLQADIESQLSRDLKKASIKKLSLKNQILEASLMEKKQVELAKLIFNSYQYGRLSFTEVQAANLRLLEVKTRLSNLKAQYLIQNFNIQYLSESDFYE